MRIQQIDVGTVSGKLTVTRVYRGEKFWMVEVACECGTIKQVAKNNFASGKTTTCGCGVRGKPFEKVHGVGGTPAYNSWKKMMVRCYNPRDAHYHQYGGRGIVVCDRWQNAANFVADMGERDVGFSIERVDNNGNYEPSNCVWLPIRMQSKNRRPWQHTDEGKKAISDSRKQDWQDGVYADKVAAQRLK
jgi:hypothetical protein